MRIKIKISEQIGVDIRSRLNANILRELLSKNETSVKLDFDKVEFISRSFADEICAIEEDYKHRIIIINTSDSVKSMLNVVRESRKQKRIRSTSDIGIKEFPDMKSLSAFLVNM